MLLLLSSFSPDNLKYRIYFNWKALFICIEMYKFIMILCVCPCQWLYLRNQLRISIKFNVCVCLYLGGGGLLKYFVKFIFG
jgi:hypothetical protein